MLEYTAFNKQVFEAVPTGAIDILDVGCGTGAMGNALTDASPGRSVTGITYSEDEAKEARKKYRAVYVHDLNDLSLHLNAQFDCIIFSHVLEHTMQPPAVLGHYSKRLKPGGRIIVALPNVLFFKQRWQFLKGNFKYNPAGGLMDSTHFRFFDFETARQLITGSGLRLISANGYGAFPLPVIRKLLPGLAKKTDRLACKLFPGLFAFQYVLIASQPELPS